MGLDVCGCLEPNFDEALDEEAVEAELVPWRIMHF